MCPRFCPSGACVLQVGCLRHTCSGTNTRTAMRSFPPEELYYITHINNLRSILEKGILSHERIEQLKLEYTSIYNDEVISRRKNKLTPRGKSLWHYVNLYFQPRNSMLFKVVHDSQIREENLVVIGVSNKVLREHSVLITDGNAANYPTQFYSCAEGLVMLKHQWPIIQRETWNEGIGTKRKMMAEVWCLSKSSRIAFVRCTSLTLWQNIKRRELLASVEFPSFKNVTCSLNSTLMMGGRLMWFFFRSHWALRSQGGKSPYAGSS